MHAPARVRLGAAELRGVGSPLPAAWITAVALIAWAFAPLAMRALTQGALFDNDDAMRLVQVRELLHGQDWFDLTQHRVDPPGSPLSHWSRLVDLPLAALIAALALVWDTDLAERVATLIWPAALLAVFVFALLRLADRLFSPATVLVSAVIIGLSPVLVFQFVPGRIDHHSIQMMLALALAVVAGRAIFDGRAGAGAFAGLLCAVMLAIGLETLPIVAATAFAFGLAWVVQGASTRRPLAFFGTALALGTLLLFVITTPPARWSQPACDALSLPWLALAVAGGGLFAGLALTTAPDRTAVRLAWMAAAGGLLCALFAVSWPVCLEGPYASVDPLVRELFLSRIGEASPVLQLVRDDPTFLPFLAFPMGGWIGLAIASLREGRRQPLFPLLLAFCTIELGVSLAQMRGIPFAATFGLFGWLYLLQLALPRPGAGLTLPRAGFALILMAAALPFGWSAIGHQASAGAVQASAEAQSCDLQSNMTALAAEPPGLVLAPVRLGPRILVATRHDVLAAPYHRNDAGNRAALEALTGDPAAARAAIEQRGVRYVAICTADARTRDLAQWAPGSLVAMLLDAAAPPWLQRIDQIGPIRAWRVRQ